MQEESVRRGYDHSHAVRRSKRKFIATHCPQPHMRTTMLRHSIFPAMRCKTRLGRPMMSRLGSAVLVAVLSCTCSITLADDPIPGIGPVGDIEVVAADLQFTEGPTVDGEGNLYFTDIPADRIHRWTEADGLSVFLEPAGHANGLMWTAGSGLRACQMDGKLVGIDIKTREVTTLAEQFEGARFNAPNDLVVDRSGGTYFTDPLYRAPTPLPQGMMSVYYVSAAGEVSRVVDDMPAPNGILLSPDEKTLYVIPSQDSKVMCYPVLEPGKLGEGEVFCEIQQTEDSNGKQGGDGAAIDTKGNLYFTTALGIQVFTPAADYLGAIAFPEHPANVTFGGSDFKTLIVTARTSVYRVRMEAIGHRYPGAQ